MSTTSLSSLLKILFYTAHDFVFYFTFCDFFVCICLRCCPYRRSNRKPSFCQRAAGGQVGRSVSLCLHKRHAARRRPGPGPADRADDSRRSAAWGYGVWALVSFTHAIGLVWFVVCCLRLTDDHLIPVKAFTNCSSVLEECFVGRFLGGLHFANLDMDDRRNGITYVCIVQNTELRSLVQGDDQKIDPYTVTGMVYVVTLHHYRYK